MAVTFRYSETVRRAASYFTGFLFAAYQWCEVEYQGLVLDVGSESCRIMSDVWGTCYYAVVWDAENECSKKVTLQVVDHQLGWSNDPVSRAWNDWHSEAEVDATPEVRAAYEAYLSRQREAKCLDAFNENLRRGEEKATEVEKGSYVETFKGRKVPVGTRGTCFWVGAGKYGYRVGFKGENGETYWTALSNVRVVPGYENYDSVCPDCGDGGWLPAYDGNGGTVPCVECEARAEAAWKARKAQEAEELAKHEAREKTGVTKGSVVEVVASGHRNDAPVGIVGKVFWVGESKFGDGERVGLNCSGQTYWAAVENVQAA
jgi:hypothetical protein